MDPGQDSPLCLVAGCSSVISRPVSGARLEPACGRDQRRGGLFKAIFGSARCQQTQVRRPISPAADPLLELETSLREEAKFEVSKSTIMLHYGLVKSYTFHI